MRLVLKSLPHCVDLQLLSLVLLISFSSLQHFGMFFTSACLYKVKSCWECLLVIDKQNFQNPPKSFFVEVHGKKTVILPTVGSCQPPVTPLSSGHCRVKKAPCWAPRSGHYKQSTACTAVQPLSPYNKEQTTREGSSVIPY